MIDNFHGQLLAMYSARQLVAFNKVRRRVLADPHSLEPVKISAEKIENDDVPKHAAAVSSVRLPRCAR